MYGSAKATKPKNIGVKHIEPTYVEVWLQGVGMVERPISKRIMDKLHNQKANEVKEDLK